MKQIILVVVVAAIALITPSCQSTTGASSPPLTEAVGDIAAEAGLAWLRLESGLPQDQIDKIALALADVRAGKWQSAAITIGREALATYLRSKTARARSSAPPPPPSVTDDLADTLGV